MLKKCNCHNWQKKGTNTVQNKKKYGQKWLKLLQNDSWIVQNHKLLEKKLVLFEVGFGRKSYQILPSHFCLAPFKITSPSAYVFGQWTSYTLIQWKEEKKKTKRLIALEILKNVNKTVNKTWPLSSIASQDKQKKNKQKYLLSSSLAAQSNRINLNWTHLFGWLLQIYISESHPKEIFYKQYKN